MLLRDDFDQLDDTDKEFCKDVILDFASMPLGDGYRYQIRDGVGAAALMLPLLIKPFPKEAKRIKEMLLFGLFDEHAVGMGQRFSDYAASAIVDGMWKDHLPDADSLFLGYILLKPKLDGIRKSIRDENYRARVYEFSETEVLRRFTENHTAEIESVINNQITYDQLPALDTVDERTLVTGFSLLPLGTEDEHHRSFVRGVCELLSKRLLDRNKEERFDYILRSRFFEKLAHFVLMSDKGDIQGYLRPFLGHFRVFREAADLFSAFVSAEDKLHQYDQFWASWELFYPSIKELCEREGSRSYSRGVVHNYLLAGPNWRKDAREWHSLKVREKAFFRKVSEEIGDHPAVLYSISKLLNEIGNGFVEDGIGWISGIIERTPDLASREQEVNTVYYLESLVRGYVLQNRSKVRTTPQIQHQVLTILNFLLEKGSATAYLLREDVLC